MLVGRDNVVGGGGSCSNNIDMCCDGGVKDLIAAYRKIACHTVIRKEGRFRRSRNVCILFLAIRNGCSLEPVSYFPSETRPTPVLKSLRVLCFFLLSIEPPSSFAAGSAVNNTRVYMYAYL